MIDQRVIVTGAGGGIGANIARHFVDNGARVVAADRRLDRLRALEESLREAPGELAIVEADVTSPDDVARTMSVSEDAFGGPDTLINNAGVSVEGGVTDLSVTDFNRMMATNVTGPFLCIKTSLALLRDGGGSVINIGSVLVTRPQLIVSDTSPRRAPSKP